MKLIFVVLDVSRTMGLTRAVIKRQFFTFIFTFIFNKLLQRVGIACYADGCISESGVCPSSVTFRCFVETNEATIMQFSPSGRIFILVLGEVKIVWKFAPDHPS